jgi:N-acetylglutamate synthase-like GNAT family acetyltransferase
LKIEIKYISDDPKYAEIVTGWIYEEFIKDIRNTVSHETLFNAISVCNKNALPIRFVALADGNCAGTVSLQKNDLRSRDYEPWLVALYVEPSYRGNKIAEKLIQRVKETAKGLGYDELYLRTEFAAEYYKQRGWDFVETCLDDVYGFETNVFKIGLMGCSARV